MQYILTQEEYDKLHPKYKDNSKAYITTLRNKLDLLEKAHSELKNKYAELLGCYVTHINEPLKGLTNELRTNQKIWERVSTYASWW